jgi:hypothetical protein
MVPVNYARRFLDIRSDQLEPRIMVKGKPGISNAQLMDELKGNLRSIRRLRPAEEDNFALNETKLISNQLNSLFAMLTKAGWIIGSFSILVGGFGIANIMFVSVKERTTIIGIQKSLGAKNFFILFQFLSESVFLCLLGGLIGLEMRPRRMREAAALWQRLSDTQGIAARDLLWSHPDLLPRDSDIDDIDAFLATGSEDLMAELNKAIEADKNDPELNS